MFGFQHDSCPTWRELFINRISNLTSETFLNLRTTRKAIDQSCQLRKPGNPPIFFGKVSDVGLAKERNEVVLTNRIKRNVAHHDDFVVLHLKGLFEMIRRLLAQTTTDFAIHSCDSCRCIEQPIPLGIFPNCSQKLTHSIFDTVKINIFGITHGLSRANPN